MNLITSLKTYLLGSYGEMKKVSWPSKKQTVNYSLLVIGLSVGVAVFFSILDYFFSYGVNYVISR